MTTTLTRKFIRNYQVSIQVVDDESQPRLLIQPPFTIEFEINKEYMSSSGSGTFRIYNLKQLSRKQIRRNYNDYLKQRNMVFKAGYGDSTPVVFNGAIQHAYDTREGTNDITQIEATDWSYAFISPDADYAGSATTGMTQKQLLQNVINTSLPGIKLGQIGAGYDQKFMRDTPVSGSSKDILQQYTGGSGTSGFFIDNGVANIVGQTEALAAQGIDTIDTNTGLLNRPLQEANILHFDMLFEPRLLMAQIINLVSVTEPQLSGQYKVVSIHHHGMISDAVCGDAITSVGLYSPQFGSINQFTVLGVS
jgi:hypothetical protein